MLRPRRLSTAALTVVIALALAACNNQDLPNTTFNPHSEFGGAIDDLWDKLLFWGTLVFVFVEAALIFVVVRYRHREGRPEPKHVHGNTTLEILWTVVPAFILAVIAIPTVKTIFQFQSSAPANAIQVNVTGHQWWWEFEYPQYGFRTANELYLPAGRTVSFHLKSQDVIHSFWIPQLGGKRDVITNRTNYLWFTPDSTLGADVWNGFCAEYCGASHANMKFRAFTLPEADFERWAAHQKLPAVFGPPAGAPGTPGAPAGTPPAPPAPGARGGAAAPQQTASAPNAAGAPGAPGVVPVAATQGGGFDFAIPRREYAIPQTPIPDGLTFTAGLTGDAERGRQLFSRSACVGCHTIGGTLAASPIGPNLTHVGSRTTIAAGLYPNDAEHLARWIKNAPAMKPGVIMPPQGKGLRDPKTNAPGMLDDAQIADIVAYLLALK
jgi:cytochrome c oxidase subunit II